MKLEIVTPEGEYFNADVETVELPGTDGHIGALENHAPLVTMIKEDWDDDLIYTINKETTELALGPGFVEICPNKVSVLTDWVYSENDDIDLDAAEDALKRAKEALENVTEDDIQVAKDLEEVIAKSMAQITVKTRSKSKN